MAKRTTASPRVWMDAYLAAFAITARLTMVTSDNDFTAFKTRGLDLMLIPTR
jgi:predicted nucleic acid-binding protein